VGLGRGVAGWGDGVAITRRERPSRLAATSLGCCGRKMVKLAMRTMLTVITAVIQRIFRPLLRLCWGWRGAVTAVFGGRGRRSRTRHLALKTTQRESNRRRRRRRRGSPARHRLCTARLLVRHSELAGRIISVTMRVRIANPMRPRRCHSFVKNGRVSVQIGSNRSNVSKSRMATPILPSRRHAQ